MLDSGVTLALGTDNAMINSPDSLLREMEFAYKISRLKGSVSALDILRMVTQNPRKVLNVGDDICLSLGKEANFAVFQLPAKDPAYALVNGADTRDISLISLNDYIWKKNENPKFQSNTRRT
jgi:cytosine/adenosine deaminase-related metal-dependent hydrolase